MLEFQSPPWTFSLALSLIADACGHFFALSDMVGNGFTPPSNGAATWVVCSEENLKFILNDLERFEKSYRVKVGNVSRENNFS